MPSRSIEFTVSDLENGFAVGEILKKHNVSLSLVRSLKRVERGITLNGEHIRTVDCVTAGDVVALNIPDDERPAVPANLQAGVVYEDDDVIVFDKPAGMTVHPVRDHRDDTLANFFAWHLMQQGRSAAFRPINRLDRNTSGLMVAALHRMSAAALSGQTEKTYVAVCEGRLEGSGIIEAPIRRREGYGISREVGEGGEYALTRYESLASCDELSLLSVRIDTGRMHQIRVHMAHIGHPLTGDDMYGGSLSYIQRHALHCDRLSFCHPVSGQPLSFESQLPGDMLTLIGKFFSHWSK